MEYAIGKALERQCSSGQLWDKQLQYRVCWNLAEAQAAVLEAGKPYITDEFLVSPDLVDEERIAWMFAFDQEGLAACCAAKLEVYDSQSLAAGIQEKYRILQIQKGIVAKAPSVDKSLEKVRGRGVYVGELFIVKRLRSYRSLSLLIHLSEKLQTELRHIWAPDFCYAFLRRRDAERGAHMAYGFDMVITKAIAWHQHALPQRSDSDVCIIRTYYDQPEKYD